jgi:predicted transcriptional regulator
MNDTMLAAVLDGRVVVLDTKNAHVMLMDAQTERVWRSCRGLTEKEIAARLEETSPSVLSTLRELAEVGLVRREDDRWTQADVAWV